MSIAGIILRSKSKEITASFYQKLELTLREHSHGGPLHFECTDFSDDPALEIYTQSQTYKNDALMVEVRSLPMALKVLAGFGLLSSEIKETQESRYVYTTDPDGRPIMLIEK